MSFDETVVAADAALSGELWGGDGGFGFLERLVDETRGRFAGTADERRAAEIILDAFERYGLQNVHREPFTYDGWTRGAPATLRRLDTGESIATFSLPGSVPGAVDAEVIDLGSATHDQIADAGEALRGKIAIISAETPHGEKPAHRNEKAARAARNGAAAVLWMRDEPGQLAETGSLFFRDAPQIPGIAITREDGLRLARQSRAKAIRLAMNTHDTPHRLESWNLLGEIPGTDLAHEVIMVGAHYDGHDVAEAANDNGSGVAAILEAARALVRQAPHLRRTVRFISFGVEELGLYGAHAYCRQHKETDLAAVRFLFNLDTIASPGMTKGVATQKRPELRSLLHEIGTAMGDAFPVRDDLSMYSDQFPFVIAGVPSGMLTNPDARRSGRGEGHTTSDTLDKVHPLSLKLSTLFTARLILYLANADPWPAHHWGDDETRETLEKAGVRPTMETEGTWPWPTEQAQG